MSDERSTGPEAGKDSRVEDWFGQSVERDARAADELSAELGEDAAEEAFDDVATGEDEQAARHGDEIDPDQGRSAYTDSPSDDDDEDAPARPDPDAPGNFVDDETSDVPEPNEPA